MSTPRALTLSLVLAALAAAPCRAASAPAPAAAPAAAPATQAKPAAPEVKASSSTLTPAQIYTVERLRDPFSAPGAGGSSSGKPYSVDTDFSIHNLSLRGVMKDPGADYALFTDSNFGVSFILRNGKLYDSRNKIVPGVAGKLKTREKWAQLETPEHDVQVFRLGEEEKD